MNFIHVVSHLQFKTLAENILKNPAEDSEIRIKAYLILSKCPCGKVAAFIKDLLAKEGSNQGKQICYFLGFFFFLNSKIEAANRMNHLKK